MKLATLALVLLATIFTSAHAFKGTDRYVLHKDIIFYHEDDTDKETPLSAGTGSRFKIIDVLKDGNGQVDGYRVEFTYVVAPDVNSLDNLSKQIQREAATRAFQRVQSEGSSMPDVDMRKFLDNDTSNTNMIAPTVGVVEKHVFYVADMEHMRKYHFSLSSGLDYGTLAVPFKLRTDDGSISSSSTLGGYVGYFLGARTSVLGTVGLASVPVNDVNSQDVETKWGITVAGGAVWRITSSFQCGVIGGIDHIGQDWAHENKFWISFSVGATFVQ